jgi:hypothetical protein
MSDCHLTLVGRLAEPLACYLRCAASGAML